MPNLKFDFSRYICTTGQSLVNALPLGGIPSPTGLTYLSKPAQGDIGARPSRQPLNISLIDGHQQLPKFIELKKVPLRES